MNELNFTVLGRRGVGKTTLITSMYVQTVNCLSGTGMSLHADLATSTQLTQKLKQLERIADETKAIVNTGGIAGTSDQRDYLFHLGPNGGRRELAIRFTDYPGGWLENIEKQNQVVQIAAKADVILVPIDTPPLMEKSGRYHVAVNVPTLIRDFLQEIQNVSDPDRPRLVIFAPIRCEKQVNCEEEANCLLEKVRDEYSTTYQGLNANTAVVITPIQTVGCLHFSFFRKQVGDDDNPIMVFKKQPTNGKYAPVNCDQPMRYLLRFLLKQHNNTKNGGLFHWLTFGFFSDVRYNVAANTLASGCKDGKEGFEVVQGRHLL